MAGDLHLNITAISAIDQVPPLIDAMYDFDYELRSLDNNADIGADEFSLSYDLIFEDGFEKLKEGHIDDINGACPKNRCLTLVLF